MRDRLQFRGWWTYSVRGVSDAGDRAITAQPAWPTVVRPGRIGSSPVMKFARPIASRNAQPLMCTPRRAIAVRPETTLLFSTGIDSPVRDGVPLTTAPSKGTPGNVLWTCELGGLFAL